MHQNNEQYMIEQNVDSNSNLVMFFGKVYRRVISSKMKVFFLRNELMAFNVVLTSD